LAGNFQVKLPSSTAGHSTRKGKLQETEGRKAIGAKVSVKLAMPASFRKEVVVVKRNILVTAGVLVAMALATVVSFPWV
jgi:hypothetical protein